MSSPQNSVYGYPDPYEPEQELDSPFLNEVSMREAQEPFPPFLSQFQLESPFLEAFEEGWEAIAEAEEVEEFDEFIDELEEEEFEEEEAIVDYFNNERELEVEVLPELQDELDEEDFDKEVEEEETVGKKTENKFENCSKSQKDLIQKAFEAARKAVSKAEAVVGSAYGRPDKMSVKTRELLNKHFHTTNRDNLLKILRKLISIRQAFEKGVSFECETKCDVLNGVRPCGYAKNTQWFGGFGDVHICFDNTSNGCNFGNLTTFWQEVLIIHEVGHRYVGLDDNAYMGDKNYSKLSPKQAISNADSYAGFSVDLYRSDTKLSHEFLDELDDKSYEEFEEEDLADYSNYEVEELGTEVFREFFDELDEFEDREAIVDYPNHEVYEVNEEPEREKKGLENYLALTSEEDENYPNLLLGETSPQDVLKRAGLKTTTWIDGKTAFLIQTVLERSRVLKPFIEAKLKTIKISKSFVLHRSDAEFNYAYLKLNKIVVPFGSEEKKKLINIRGFYHRPTDSIHVRPSTNVGQALQFTIYKLSSPAFGNFFGKSLEDGVSLYFTNLILEEQGLEQMKSENYKDQLNCATDLVNVVSQSIVGKAYFQNHLDLVNYLTTKLIIGPVRAEELARDALCKTSLLRTARFANHQIKNMVAVGITSSRSVQLWMRTDVPGMHEIQIFGGSGGTKNTKIMIPEGQPGDKTITVKYPQTSEQTPLDPLTKYRYRIVRTSDGTPLGEGAFETSPASDSDTPQKVVIGVMSCHQPFTNRGTIAEQSDRMLRLIPKILQENNVKFMLLCGDQIYSDYPEKMSLFGNPYLIRQSVPGKTSIFNCSSDEVRRIYDRRYRMFRSMVPIQKMYANYPCYPAIDDHEIDDDWGSMREHSGARYRNILSGARQAYFDYQASSVLPPMTQMPNSFHYNFSYGNIGVFVMDIRSERFPNSSNQLYSEAQLKNLSQFLRTNSQKKVLLIVSSVPVIYIPSLIADTGHKFTGPSVDFLDQWSFEKNIKSRNLFLSLLHKHQQANPKQRIAIVSGDLHISCAFGINWRGGNKPRLYQFTSSAITNLFQGWKATAAKVGAKLTSSITCPPTLLGESCKGEVSLLPAVEGANSRNPLIGLNLGLIEVQRFGDVSNLKFKLIGYHPEEQRPVTYFESSWLG